MSVTFWIIWRRSPGDTLLIGLLLTSGSYFALCMYDFMALRYLHKKVPLGRVVIASFIANAFGHNLGFAAFTGAAFRLRLYASSRLTAIDVATVTGFTSITTALGLAVLAGLVLSDPPRAGIKRRLRQSRRLAGADRHRAAGRGGGLCRVDRIAPRAPGISRLAAATAGGDHRCPSRSSPALSTWACPAQCCG